MPVGTTSPAKTVTLTNTGATALNITSINLAGPDPGEFAPTADTCPISPAVVSVSDGGGGSPQTALLVGTGQ